MSFGGNDAVQLNVGHGGSSLKLDEPGTYRYAVHFAGVKAHAHTGTVVVMPPRFGGRSGPHALDAW